MENNTFETLNFTLLEGRFPKNENEIVIGKHIITNGEVELKLGDKLNLDIGRRQTLNGYDLDESNPYVEEEGEKISDAKKYEFTIVRNNRKTKVYF